MLNVFNIVNRIKAVKTFKGIDNQGFKSIVFILKEKPRFELKTTKIASRILTFPNEYRLFISLLDDNETSSEIFDVLVEDLLSSIENAINEQEVLEILASRFHYWSDLFKRKKEKLDEKWIRGFIGELWFLDNVLIEKITVDLAVKSWIGPEKANQDFITENKIFEVKTKTKQANYVKISNDNQLESDMYLVVIETNKSSEVSNESVNLSKLIKNIQKKINNPATKLIFNEKLLELGIFPIEEAKLYDKFSYNIQSISYFSISEDFPIIHHSAIPKSIVKYSYDLLLSGIDNLKVSGEDIWD